MSPALVSGHTFRPREPASRHINESRRAVSVPRGRPGNSMRARISTKYPSILPDHPHERAELGVLRHEGEPPEVHHLRRSLPPTRDVADHVRQLGGHVVARHGARHEIAHGKPGAELGHRLRGGGRGHARRQLVHRHEERAWACPLFSLSVVTIGPGTKARATFGRPRLRPTAASDPRPGGRGWRGGSTAWKLSSHDLHRSRSQLIRAATEHSRGGR